MAAKAFDTPIADDGISLAGPWRAPQQMLAAQVYDGHVSIHDDAMAKKMGFKAATLEGPTHFSQFAPLLRAPMGRGVVRERMHLGALSQRGLRRRRGAGARRQADGWRDPGRHSHGEA